MFKSSFPRIVVGFLLISAGAAQAAEIPLGITLSRQEVSVGLEQSASVTYTLSNLSDEPLYVLDRQTPLHGVRGDLFEVRRNGEPVSYIGAYYRFLPPREVDYLRLEAGQRISLPVDLESVYDFSLPGTYTVRVRAGLAGFRREAEAKFVPVTSVPRSRPIRLEVERAARPELETAPAAQLEASPAESLTPSFALCSSSQISQISQALPLADQMAQKAKVTLALGQFNTPPSYTTWFGTYSMSRYQGVLFDSIYVADTLKNRQLTFTCDCFDRQTLAFVFKSDEGLIHICTGYWTVPITGLNSKADTIVHEVSHWPNWGGDTDDYAYGINSCLALALINPNNAVDNADNFSYFAASQP